MVIGTKFWPILAPANYAPSAHPQLRFFANSNGTTTISGIDAGTIAAMTAISAPLLGITGPGIKPGDVVASIGPGPDEITMTTALSFAGSIQQFHYYDKTYPAAGVDQPIQAVLCLDSNHSLFEFVDNGGRTVTIPANTLAKGAVYYFQIGQVTAVTPLEFIGYAAN